MNSTTTNKQSIQPPPQVAEAPDDPAPPAGPGQRMKRERPDGPHSFAVRTRIVRATGSDDRYPCGAVRALPSPNRDTVVLQATDGKQAVCLLTTGRMAQPCLVPPGVLPTRQSGSDVIVRMVDEYWQSSEGKHAPDTYGPLTDQFPSVAEVLPIVGKRLFHETQRHAEQRRQTAGQGESMHIMLGVDVELLRKIAESLGNSKLTLFVPVQIKNG